MILSQLQLPHIFAVDIDSDEKEREINLKERKKEKITEGKERKRK